MRPLKLVRGLAGLAAFAIALPAFAQANPQSEAPVTPTVTQTIEVTATRTPEDVETVPASVTVISGDDIAARGARDLPSALALVAGVAVAPGGENGPAGSVPEIWGLREFDAFLLVVDGVPWGGAFNPALPSLDLNNVERIEILRGAAPVMYGATSFVGVIQVIHRPAGAAGRTASVWGGSFGSGGAAVSTPLPQIGGFRQSLTVDGERQGFKDDRTKFNRGHVLYRSSLDAAGGSFRFDLDGSVVDQKPASPTPIEDPDVAFLTKLDTNQNPSDAKIDENRLHFVAGYDRKLAGGSWSTTLAVTHTKKNSVRGFLTDVSEDDPNAEGFHQNLTSDDVYFDSHVSWRLGSAFHLVAGVDHLYGESKADSETFDYLAPLSGHGAPSSKDQPLDHGFNIDDKRNFSGLYLQGEWDATDRLHFLAGARLNRTDEKRTAGDRELSFPDPGDEGTDQRTNTKLSGVVGVNWLAWGDAKNGLWLFGDYRNTFKPAALDFGPEAEPDILNPETARSYEVGLKNRVDGDRFEWELTAFQMDFENLVVPQANEDGLPELINAGSERFKGVELDTRGKLCADLWWRATYAWHDAKFRKLTEELDGEDTVLDGNRLQLSAKALASAGLIYSPAHGFFGSVTVNYTGSRVLDEQNEILAPSFTTWAAGIGYRAGVWELRLDGLNLNDTRPPVSLSELGDGQYYILPARSLRLTLSTRF
ncbi:MAG TPA: TonB-dependent receptor [Thermoanaerobaculia bacterium]|jgi:iron complex outermembrane receptor protein|nr:TonB-dependent receptor [Thermoanaerobaculia bacterium]